LTSLELSSIAYVHGDKRRLVDLDDETAHALTEPPHGLAHYRASEFEAWQLATAAARRTLALAGRLPDLLLYVSETDRCAIESLALIARALELAQIRSLAVSGHECGNLGSALTVARDALAHGDRACVLVVTADRALAGGRLMTSGMSVFSDGAAACIVSSGSPGAAAPGSARFSVDGIAVEVDAGASEPDSSGTMLTSALLAARAAAALAAATGRRGDAFRSLILPNYRISSQRFLASAVGMPEDKLLLGALGELGHSFAADLLVTLEQARRSESLAAGDRVLLGAPGPYSWSLLDVACL
jgi:3-oxoacyl-[acyl-carrier-protein] synthase III